MDSPHMGTLGRENNTFLAGLYMGLLCSSVFELGVESRLNEHCTTRFAKEAHVGRVEFHLFEAVSQRPLGCNFIVARL